MYNWTCAQATWRQSVCSPCIHSYILSSSGEALLQGPPPSEISFGYKNRVHLEFNYWTTDSLAHFSRAFHFFVCLPDDADLLASEADDSKVGGGGGLETPSPALRQQVAQGLLLPSLTPATGTPSHTECVFFQAADSPNNWEHGIYPFPQTEHLHCLFHMNAG